MVETERGLAPGGLARYVPTADSSEDAVRKYRALFNGVRAGDQPAVRTMLAQGMDVNLRGPRGATPLHIAARFGQAAMCDLLLSHGADSAARST